MWANHRYFNCSSCRQIHPQPKAAKIFNDNLCQACFDHRLRPAFETHLKDESKPALWVGKPISIESVSHQFSSDFLAQYRARLEEYATDPLNRLYCAMKPQTGCTKLIGTTSDEKSARFCESCKVYTCARCGVIMVQFRTHTCSTSLEADRFQGLQRGIDYQICPRCRTPARNPHLGVICNLAKCPMTECGADYCFLCGEWTPSGLSHSDHWSSNKGCLLYGRPEDPRNQDAGVKPSDDESRRQQSDVQECIKRESRAAVEKRLRNTSSGETPHQRLMAWKAIVNGHPGIFKG